MKQIIITIITISIVVATALAYTLSQTYIKNQAIDGCLHAGTDTVKTVDGTNAQVPDGYWYTFCLKEKGVKGLYESFISWGRLFRVSTRADLNFFGLFDVSAKFIGDDAEASLGVLSIVPMHKATLRGISKYLCYMVYFTSY